MKRIQFIVACLMIIIVNTQAQQKDTSLFYKQNGEKIIVDRRIDNMSYWRELASRGIVPIEPAIIPPKAKNVSCQVIGRYTKGQDSPDIPVTQEESFQSENSLFINPNDKDNLVNSNNSATSSIWGANDFYSFDQGITWDGDLQGAGANNSGDPSVVIDRDWNYYIGHIHSNGGQGIAISSDSGATWQEVVVAELAYPGPFSLLDKNHLWVDNSYLSPYEGTLYDAWSNFDATPNQGQIEISRSIDGGFTWSSPIEISSTLEAGSHNQGVNIQTGPNGEVYAVWTIYDYFPGDESAIGFAKSTDTSFTFTSKRIIDNIRGIRNTGVNKNMRVNSFPVMAVDVSGGPFNGNIYVVWTNMGVPGENVGPFTDIYFMKSIDRGETWSTPVTVNQDNSNSTQYLPWITCDQVTGTISIVFYDDRNVGTAQVETWIANSFDAGETWEEMRVSDVVFSPQPIEGSADGYFGDYLSITANGGTVFPCWTDNRTGTAMTYISPIETGPTPGQPFVVYFNYEINDEEENNNSAMDSGETLGLNFSVRNLGDMDAQNITASIFTDNPYVTILDDTAIYDLVEPLDIISINNAFIIKTDENIPDGERVLFNLTTTNGDSIWHSNFSIEAHAINIEIQNLVVADNLGNNNQVIETGEVITLGLLCENTGDYEAKDVIVSLNSTSDALIIDAPTQVVDIIQPNSSAEVYFMIMLNGSIFNDDYISLVFNTKSGAYYSNKYYIQPVGVKNEMESFESNNFEAYNWENNSPTPWFVDNSTSVTGGFSARSGNIADNEETTLMLDINLIAADSISFYTQMSSELNADVLKFYIDGIEKRRWSGTEDWRENIFSLSEGYHQLKWKYEKDYSVSSGNDCAWLDDIKIPQKAIFDSNLQVFAFPVNSTICANDSTQLYAVAFGGNDNYNYAWSPATSLSNSHIANPYAKPQSNTNYTVVVSSGSETVVKTVPVIMDTTDLNLGNDTIVHYGETLTLNPQGDFIKYLWSDSTSNPSFIVDPNTYTENHAEIWLQTINQNGCFDADSMQLSFYQTSAEILKEAHAEKHISPNPAEGQIFVSDAKGATIHIIDINGNVLIHKRITSQHQGIDISALISGTYLVEIKYKNKLVTEKLVVVKR